MSLRMEAGFEHLREAMASVLAKEVEFPPGTLVTVLGAKMTANTMHAKIILSIFPTEAKEGVLRALKEYDREIKEGLAERLRLRRIPRLHYVFDETEAQAEEIEAAINEIKKKEG